MKRRGFLASLFGLAAAPVAAKLPKPLLEGMAYKSTVQPTPITYYNPEYGVAITGDKCFYSDDNGTTWKEVKWEDYKFTAITL